MTKSPAKCLSLYAEKTLRQAQNMPYGERSTETGYKYKKQAD